MSDLTNEEKETLKRLRQDYEDDQKTNSGRESHITNPDKYNFPIGMDDKGNLNVVKDENKDNSR
jgi:hypothetical protein